MIWCIISLYNPKKDEELILRFSHHLYIWRFEVVGFSFIPTPQIDFIFLQFDVLSKGGESIWKEH